MASAGNSENSNEVILIAYEKAINTGPPSRREQERQYYEEQPVPQGELTLEKSGVGKMLLASSVVAAIAGGYYGVKFYKSRQEGLVRDFAYSMMLYWVSLRLYFLPDRVESNSFDRAMPRPAALLSRSISAK